MVVCKLLAVLDWLVFCSVAYVFVCSYVCFDLLLCLEDTRCLFVSYVGFFEFLFSPSFGLFA